MPSSPATDAVFAAMVTTPEAAQLEINFLREDLRHLNQLVQAQIHDLDELMHMIEAGGDG